MASLPHSAGAGETPSARTDAVTALLLLVGAASLITGAWLFLAPGSFYDVIATYPPQNDHFLRDVGSFQVALGAAAVYGARRASWRAPMLAILALQYALHTVSHLINIDDTDPQSLGAVNFALLLGVTVLLTAFFVKEQGR
jgi:hypothetical protein